jgi:hypothetical protein
MLRIMLPVVKASLLRILRCPAYGVTIATSATTTRLIAEQTSPFSNSRRRLALKPNLDPESDLWPSFSKKSIHSKGS